MRKVIQSRIYDTDKATKVADYWNCLSTSDFNNLSESIYRTKKGSWFLHGIGGYLIRIK